MHLHEFMTACRDEILDACRSKLEQDPINRGLSSYAQEFFDETLRAMRRDSGVPSSQSPLPAASDAAARLGEDQQRAGVAVTHVPVIFASLSQALGETGQKYELTISAEEYKLLNRCLDTGVATAIENFWRRDRERENHMITERFGFMAHELRNALANASLAFKLVRSGNLDIHGRTADVVARNLNRMEAVVAQCLGSVQLEVGVSPELSPVQVASVLRNLQASAIPDRGILITVDVDESLVIAADDMLLTSAISNLLHNALKFSPPGAAVYLRAKAFNGHVLIEVEDEAGGLQGQDPSALFEPYVKRREGNSKGTGLGLSIAKRAVEAMHGHLSVADHPGRGCVFTARFKQINS